MLAYELKKYIIDNNKIICILENLNCHSIKIYKKNYRCGLPNHHNKTSISIKADTLKCNIFLPDNETIYGDIFTLIMHLKNYTFTQANQYIHKIFNLPYSYQKIQKKKDIKTNYDPLDIFSKIRQQTNITEINIEKIYNDDILKEYIPYPHIDWVREGIMPYTCEEFKIGYSLKSKRIIIPHRYWSGAENEYLGIIGRTTIKEWKLLDIAKYIAVKPFSKNINLYGLQENYLYIQKAGYICVFEAEKSVLKAHSWNEKIGTAVCGHGISPEQERILISLNVEIIIAMDNEISINYVRALCDKFYKIRNVSYIYDKYELLGGKKEKNSPVDCGKKKFDYLLNYRIKYDELERSKFLKWQEKHQKK